MRVHHAKKSNRGRDYNCQRCGKKIEPGESYTYWTFYRGATVIRCHEHPPRPSDLTQSNMQPVLVAMEAIEDLGGTDFSEDDIKGAVDELVSAANEARDLYEEAAEHFGGEGENAERRDAMESFANDVESVELDAPEKEHDTCSECGGDGVLHEEEEDEGEECHNCGGDGYIEEEPDLTEWQAKVIDELTQLDPESYR